MWVMLSDCFLSIVHKDCARDELLVRARRSGDISKIFPAARVSTSEATDYRYRAVVKQEEVERAMVGELRRITYGNFKGSVTDGPLHDAYLRVWIEMEKLQPRARTPRSTLFGRVSVGDEISGAGLPDGTVITGLAKSKKKRRRKPRKNLKGR